MLRHPLIRVLLAALASYLWGMVFWGFNPLPYTTWKHAVDDEAAGAAIAKHFPETGTYYFPGMYLEEEERTRLHERGPVGFVHVTAHEGRPIMDPSIMVLGFVLTLGVAAVLAWLLRQAAPALPSYGRRVGFIAVAGFAASLAIHIGDHVWWLIAIEWKLYQAFYETVSWTLMGAVLAADSSDS